MAMSQVSVDERSSGPNPILVTGLAIVLVVAAIGLYVYLGQKPPVAAGEISKVWIYSVHTKSASLGGGGEGVAGEATPFDQVLVLVQLKLRNQSKGPIFLREMTTTVQQDGENVEANAVGANDFERAFVAYPKMKPAKGTPLLRDTTLEAGQQVEGQFLTHMSMTQEDWDKRKGIVFTIGLKYQKSLVLQLPKDVEVIQ